MQEAADTAQTLAGDIRSAGLKSTSQRVAVLAALQQAPHSSADSLLASVRSELPGISAQAVYGILSAFTEAGLARRVEPPGSPALYESRVGDNHHHLVCIRCGAIKDVDCVIGQAPCLTPSDDSGFTILAAEVTFSGICSTCAQQADSSAR
ncbi:MULTISPECIES: Fur family transcriptional regulator [unclassified Arthrobacter]|uniref:Fur family transcriptional regulator n=1 Tax=unclassified Arthrobacter TaxID=235627 RepID=UPI001E444681|nr:MULTISPECIES: Fur family transcriptional regulator [unclassified Arthrobacter]MCC9145272.1 transcriptional repressor [Arthrobacter sp. zg-Y919]MDK1276500.1 Fur family transcriptional regulator [Arthrobacter sp. zg.Y919]MDM7989142.1 Fur family transcriptional regulator [Arthrobacter sp. zg-Y877]WIB01905.1 Fur family transcriptional regulator [Arthrobacter sp. zg-Y919]